MHRVSFASTSRAWSALNSAFSNTLQIVDLAEFGWPAVGGASFVDRHIAHIRRRRRRRH